MKRLTPILVLAVAGVLAGVASAAAPANTAKPTISGTDKSGSTLTADPGSWSNSPTSFTYRWRRCATDGSECDAITGATKKTYVLTLSDVHHTVRVSVTAKNADGSASATSVPTNVVGTANGPDNTSKPTVSGTTTPGEQLTVSDGSWTPTPTSFDYQWQRCTGNGGGCSNVSGATSKTYSVRSADVGSTLRALVTAHVKGETTVASSKSDVVASGTSTTVVTTTVEGNKAPTIKFISLRRVGIRVYARFRVCDDTLGKISITERDHKTRQLSYRRRFTVYRTSSCGTFSRHWTPAARFRTKGRYVVTLRASDTSGALSRLVSRSLLRR
jgi:hypothetical protein